MNEDQTFDSRSAASYALGQLLFKESSVEVGVRSVLRIAEHRGFTWWRVWATLQLVPFNAGTLGEDITRMVKEDFPEEKRGHQASLYGDQFLEYSYLRWQPETEHYAVDGIAKLEKLCALAEAAYIRGQDDLRQIVLMNTEILSRIKSRVQEFLTAIEAGHTPVPPKVSHSATSPDET